MIVTLEPPRERREESKGEGVAQVRYIRLREREGLGGVADLYTLTGLSPQLHKGSRITACKHNKPHENGETNSSDKPTLLMVAELIVLIT